MKKTIKHILNQLADKHIFSIISATIILMFIYRYATNSFELNNFTSGIIVNILSGWGAGIAAVLLYVLERTIKVWCEDGEKLTEDYQKLVEMYSEDNLIEGNGSNGSNDRVIFPVVLLGSVGNISITEEDISISDDPNDEYHLPAIIEEHFPEIFKAHGTGGYNSNCIRVLDMVLDENGLKIKTGRTTYYNSLVTNRAFDWKWGGITTRELYEYGPRLSSLKDSKLSNHLGFNGFLESCDGKIVFVKRKSSMSIAKFTYGDSVGAVIRTKYALDEKGNFTVAGLRNAVISSIGDELKIVPENINVDSIKIIAAYRDCVEGGKPQILFYATSNLTASEIEINFNKNNFTGTDGTSCVWIDRQKIIDNKVDIFPDRMVAEVTQNGYKKKLNMNMVPSASACVVLLQRFLGDKYI
jgi:hypothetical protein